ncbi:hypothetical protein [Celeribacter neptunius]|uniref:Uncharacterized protein n=1 Tax=Celeribacter neptunius TaxID=588602 RepID=A0A1I3LN96_9RHOB|nr:hypothetical protein [Celeribacter neptunius]SFI86228.1 hypothetical protein SAMN04487991_1093 [Celeribacter neptunius]
MQISSAYQQAAFMGATKDTFSLPARAAGAVSAMSGSAGLPSAQANAADPVDSALPQTSKQSAIRAARDIFAPYDLTAISPTEIDQLTRDLKTARFDDLGFVLGLEREGASYRQEMENSGSVYGIGDAGFNADAPVNLIDKTRADLALAQRYGQDTERLSHQLEKLEVAQMSRVSLPPAARPQLAENLILLQTGQTPGT